MIAKWNVRRTGLALLTSLLLFAASPGQWSLAPLAFFALVPLFFACRGLSPRDSARLGLTSGLVYYLGLIYWIIIALGRYGGLPLWLTLPALLGLALYMALYLATFAAAGSWAVARGLPLVWIAPLAWVGLDFIRGRLFTGFPWLDLGYSQYDWPLINQIADLNGHYGLTFLIVMANAWLVELLWGRSCGHCPSSPFRKRTWSAVILRRSLPLLLFVIAGGYSTWRYRQLDASLTTAPQLSIGLLQGNVDQSEKWQAALQEKTVDTYLALSEQAMADQAIDLLIWPETALPFFPESHPLFRMVTDYVAAPGPDGPSLLTGAPHFQTDPDSGQTRYFNSAFLIAPTATVQGVALQRYDKEHLVPFGEYIPLQRFLPTAMPLVETMGNFSPGQDVTPLLDDKTKLGVLVCFESIFPDLARVRTSRGANLLVNLTNDAWYGYSSAPYQQVPMAVLRAIENRRSMARAANTGISCLIDPLGRVLAASAIFEKTKINGHLPLFEGQSVYSRYGFLFPHLCLLLLSLTLLYGMLRRDRRQLAASR